MGLCANRDCQGRFTLGGSEYRLPVDDGHKHLHGGPDGFDQRLRRASSGASEEGPFVRPSPDGEESYPGTPSVEATYLPRHDDTVDRLVPGHRDPAHVRQPHHWNLNGGRRNFLDPLLWMGADRFDPVDAGWPAACTPPR